MWQEWVTGTIVAIAAVYALWYGMPAGLRRRLGRVQKTLGEKPGCSACSNCGGCSTGAAANNPVHGRAAREPIWMQPRP